MNEQMKCKFTIRKPTECERASTPEIKQMMDTLLEFHILTIDGWYYRRITEHEYIPNDKKNEYIPNDKRNEYIKSRQENIEKKILHTLSIAVMDGELHIQNNGGKPKIISIFTIAKHPLPIPNGMKPTNFTIDWNKQNDKITANLNVHYWNGTEWKDIEIRDGYISKDNEKLNNRKKDMITRNITHAIAFNTGRNRTNENGVEEPMMAFAKFKEA